MSETALDLLAALVLEDGRRWGEAAVPVQWQDSRAVLDTTSSTPLHWLGRARGYSKTTDLAGMAIAAMLVQAPERGRLYGLAADAAQGSLLVDSIAGFAARTPEIQGALKIQEFKVVATRSGASLTILPTDSASIWRLRPHLAVVDELTQWHDSSRSRRVWEGLTTGLAKVRDSRLAVIATAGDPAHWSRAIRDHALDDPLWHVHEVEGPPPWLDPRRLQGERRRLPESSYRRLFLNEWAASEDRLADEDDLLACLTLGDYPLPPKPGTRYVVGVDIGVKSDRTVAAICHAEPHPGSELPRIVLDRMQVWTPSRLRHVRLTVVEEWVEEFSRRYNRARLVFDPSQGLQMMQRLKRAGLSVSEFAFSQASVGRLATTLLQLIREHALALPDDDPELLDELRNVRLREPSPGVFRLDHERNRHDDRAIALALAAESLVRKPTPNPLRVVSAVHLIGRDYAPLGSDRDRLSPAADGRGLEAFR
jgi:hypothetical protein